MPKQAYATVTQPHNKIYGLVAGILRSQSGLGRAKTARRSLRLGEFSPTAAPVCCCRGSQTCRGAEMTPSPKGARYYYENTRTGARPDQPRGGEDELRAERNGGRGAALPKGSRTSLCIQAYYRIPLYQSSRVSVRPGPTSSEVALGLLHLLCLNSRLTQRRPGTTRSERRGHRQGSSYVR